MAAYNIEQIKDKKKLVKLANYGTAERRNMRPKVLIGAGEEKPFIEGDILDANATQNLIEDTYNKGRIFRSFSKEGKKIDKEIKELLEKTNENYEQLSSAIADNKEDADQKIDQLSSKVDNIESNIPNLRRVVDIQLQSVLDGTKTYLVTKQGDVQEEMQISDGEKGEQGEKGDPFTYEDFTPEQIEGLKVKGDRGVSISSLEQTQTAYTSGGVNEFTITLDDGTVSRWYVRNGQKGDATKIWVNANTVHSGYYDSDNHEIKLLNADGGIMSIIDATAFIKDGMISDAYVEDGYIVIVFNTDSGKTPIMIPVTDIFDADDYYTKLDTDARIAEDVLVETQRAEAAELQLTDNLAQEVSDRLSGDTTLNTKIETETTRATNAEEALSDAIDAEESTRIQEIDDLQDLLDAYIQSNNAAVQAEISRATAAEQTNATAIATESGRAQSAEQNLQNDIDAEEQRAIAAEQDLLTAVDELEQSAGQGITEVQQALSDEITRATGAESLISADLSAEITRATNADNANATAISNEVARATLSEQQNATDIDAIEALIPSQATSENQLADKAFVNSSIATNTATFVGTFNSITDLYAVTTADVNDYGYVVTTDSVGNTKYNRYKYDGSQWDFEYSLNNSSFTAEEWASIQSGMTQALREKLESLPSSATTSIGVSVPTGFTVTGSPIVSSGTIAINFADGYSIPTIASQTNWDTAYSWGNHANAGYVKQVKVGTDTYNPTGGIVSLPAYPTSLPASDVYSWAKASTKPSYTLDEISDGSTRSLANYLPLSGGTISNNLTVNGQSIFKCGFFNRTNPALGSLSSGTFIINASLDTSGSRASYGLYIWDDCYDGTAKLQSGYDDGTTYALGLALQPLGGNVGVGYSGDIRALNYTFSVNGSINGTSVYYDGNACIHAGNIGSQSVNHATSADKAKEVYDYREGTGGYFSSVQNGVGGGTGALAYAYGNNPILFYTYSTERVRITGGGYVGIGTTTPAQKLDVDGSISIKNNNYIAVGTDRFIYHLFDSSNTANNLTIVAGGVAQAGMVQIRPNGMDYDTNTTTFLANGNVGIGTTSPSAKLYVKGQATFISGRFYQSLPSLGSLNEGTIKIKAYNDGNEGTYGLYSWVDIWSGTAFFQSGYDDGVTSPLNISLQPLGGNVGIGFTSTNNSNMPKYPLHINTAYAVHAFNNYSLTSFTQDGHIISTIGSGSGSPAGTETYGILQLYQSNEEKIRLYASNNSSWINGGNLGIGTTSPSYKLHVVGDCAATNFYTTSDSSKKDNITSLSEHIRKFTLKETGKEHYGVIAQEVEEMFREGEEGSYTVNYNSILSYYIGLLENRVAELENKVKELSHG